VAPAFTLLTRADCGLCAELRAALHAQARGRDYTCELCDVDAEPALRARWGPRIPVLLRGERLICEGHLDAARVEAEFGSP
jgi:hypothetical protein